MFGTTFTSIFPTYPLVTFAPACGAGTSISAHNLFSNASLAPAQTLSSRLEKKSEEALLCMKSIPLGDDDRAGDDAFDDGFPFPLLTPIRIIVETSRPMVEILRPPTRIFSVVLLSFFGKAMVVDVGRHIVDVVLVCKR